MRRAKLWAQRALPLVCAVAAAGCGDGVVDAPLDSADMTVAPDGADDAQDTAEPEDLAPPSDLAQEGWVPANVSELYGAWENDDGGIVRRYEFRFLDHDYADMTATTPAYRLYKGPAGDLTQLERGALALQYGPVLQTTPVWALDQTSIGQVRKVPFVPAAEPDTLALEVVPGVARVFTRVATYKWP